LKSGEGMTGLQSILSPELSNRLFSQILAFQVLGAVTEIRGTGVSIIID
jgi:hypothetical protein